MIRNSPDSMYGPASFTLLRFDKVDAEDIKGPYSITDKKRRKLASIALGKKSQEPLFLYKTIRLDDAARNYERHRFLTC